MKNVIGYIRDAQEKEQIRQYCKEHDLNLTDWKSDFDEIVYGAVTTEAVVVAKSDWDINVYYYYKMMLRKKDIELISVSEDFGQSTTLEAFTLCAVQMERENIKHRMAGGRRVKAKEGGYSGGRAPYGYRIEDGEYVINESEAEVVRLIFEKRAAGASLLKIKDELNDAGYKTRNGKEFQHSLVQNVLNNKKTYQGFYHYKGANNGEWVQGKHEPILPPDEEV